jgi:hypothetical protein
MQHSVNEKLRENFNSNKNLIKKNYIAIIYLKEKLKQSLHIIMK